MDCNKDEAVRAKEIAEKKLLEQDFTGAKKFALKAQNLFPQIDGISPLIEIINLHVANEMKINGEVNYYAVLDVDPLADNEFLKKQYKKLALALHPDKNKSVGAEGAFQIISQAWSFLSDKNARSAYNLRLNIRAPQTPLEKPSFPNSSCSSSTDFLRVPKRPIAPQTVPEKMSFPNFFNVSKKPRSFPNSSGSSFSDFLCVPKKLSQPVNSVPHPPPPPTTNHSLNFPAPPRNPEQASVPRGFQESVSRPKKTESFWTICNRCRWNYEYSKIYLNLNLLCCQCRFPFMAKEMSAPILKRKKYAPRFFPHQKQGVSAGSSSSATRADQTAAFKPSSENLKRKHEETSSSGSATSENFERKHEDTSQHKMDTIAGKDKVASACDIHSNGLKKENLTKKAREDVAVKKTSTNLNGDSGAEPDVPPSCSKTKTPKEFSPIEIQLMLKKKAKMEILHKLNEWKISDSKSDPVTNGTDNTMRVPKSTVSEGNQNVDVNPGETVTMNVPDSDFHNFDIDRVEKSFRGNQVWAAYDDDDGMPRYYALIHEIKSRKPFEMQIKWLNSRTTSEFGFLDWVSHGFTKTCGDFRAGKSKEYKSLTSFSHPIKWKRGPKGVFQIFPTKGDVWALFKNWSRDWNEFTEDNIIHVYDLVVVLEDYDGDKGTLVAPLIKVEGFTSMFLLDESQNRTILRDEMFRFSHQVPFRIVDGNEAENAPTGCYELDPAALPLDLLTKTLKQ